MDFEKICMMFTMQEPFYGIILSAMQRTPVPASACPTIGVARSGNVFKLGYNPDFINNLSVDTVLELLKHECLHIALNHFTLWDSETRDPQMHEIRNVAEDLEVNCYINMNIVRKEIKGVHPDDFGWDKNLGAREYLSRLLQKIEQEKQKQQAQNPQTPCNGGLGGDSEESEQSDKQQSKDNSSNNQSSLSNPNKQNGQGDQSNNSDSQNGQPDECTTTPDFLSGYDSLDDHSLWPDKNDASELEAAQQMVESLLAFAAEETEKRHGTIPGEMTGVIERIRRRPKPATDWKRHFRRYMGNEFTEFIRKSKKRESRRFPDAAGNRHRRKSNILVAIDTSGSVSMPEYREFFGQIKTLTASASFHVLECDSVIQYEYDFKNQIPEVLHGHGGTDFQPVIDYFIKNKHKYDALVYFTDGYSDIPRDTPKETLWVISSDGDKNRKRYLVNGASVAFISKQNG